VELSDGGKDAAVVREFDTRTGTFDDRGFKIPEAKSDYAWIDRDTLLVAHEWQKGQLTESGYPYIVKTVKKDNAVAFDIIDTYQNVEDPVKGCNLD